MNYPPFDLEKALAGELVVLRDGRRAQVVYDLRHSKFPKAALYPLIGTPGGNVVYSWTESGIYYMGDENSKDIVGMWVEPKRMITVGSISYPAPLLEAPEIGESVWIVWSRGVVFPFPWSGCEDDIQRLEFGDIFSSEDDARLAAEARAKINRGEF